MLVANSASSSDSFSSDIQVPSDTNTGMIIGIVVAGVVIGVIAGFFLYKRKKLQAGAPAFGEYEDGYVNGNSPTLATNVAKPPRHGEATAMDLSPLEIYRVDAASVTILGSQPIAAGAFGEVWVGTCGRDTVAIKRNKQKSRPHVLKLIDEIKLLARMESPYIVSFKGVFWTHPADLECLVEYMDLGDLRSFLGAHTAEEYTWAAKAQAIQSIVRGLEYLHSFNPPVIHRDLKSRNVLLDSIKGVKLSDFGESREIEDDETLTNGIGTFQWMAPEIITDNYYSVAADVYSFGVLLSEFSTHALPYADAVNPVTQGRYNQHQLTALVAKGAIKPTVEMTHTPLWVRELAADCLASNPDDRPTSLQLVGRLRAAGVV
ncbi:protein kinase [Achlya hypogyna]|uniref:Protein kinase n=1 Tax=Achlya hypogyna TaxID=1202772 RepID=A0A1V9YP32_ACHHY|nr:protein kinase [Achlya hypogyna]